MLRGGGTWSLKCELALCWAEMGGVVRDCGTDMKFNQSINQSINRRNFYSAPYKTWTAALDNVNI